MKLFGWDLSLQRKIATTIDINTFIQQLEQVWQTSAGISVTPENCMQSPTMSAIVNGVSRCIASLPVHVYQKTVSQGRAKRELLESHPVERLLNKPNEWQTRVDYWLDATSCLMRYGRYYAYKARGVTGPIRRLIPLQPAATEIMQDEGDYSVTFKISSANGGSKVYGIDEVHYARGPARDFLRGNSPVTDIREAIALEIAAERFGASFFGGGAMPGVVFELMEGFQGFKTAEERLKFIEDFQLAYGARGSRFKTMLMPKGIKMADKLIGFENDKAQFLETRKYQRTVIAGAMGIPLYLVGDLERQTFNNAEQQSTNKATEAALPTVRIFEAAMERDFLTVDDRNSGVIIRFNLDGMLRGDFLTRQQGQKIQREGGVINANEWRENENMNPRTDEHGEDYWDQGPSGQNANMAQPKPATSGTGGANAGQN